MVYDKGTLLVEVVAMPIEDKMIAMHARHAIARSMADISELNISCCRGVVELNGKIRRPRNYTGEVNMTKEFHSLINHVRGAQGVKDVIADRVQVIE